MKEFSCGDVVPGCKTKFRFATEDEILAAVAVHARDAHGISAPPPELVSKVRELIYAVAA